MQRANRVLLIGGFLLLGTACVIGVLNPQAWETIGALGLLGTGMLIVSVFAPRMSGRQELGLHKWIINLAAQQIIQAEAESAAGQTIELEALVHELQVPDAPHPADVPQQLEQPDDA